MVPCVIGHDETLGRGVFERKYADKREKVRTKLYARSFPNGAMSVDRLDYADLPRLRDLHDCEALHRESVNNFYGWYEFPADLAYSLNMAPQYKRTEKNPWHAEVYRPQEAENDEWITCYTKLAGDSKWRDRASVQQELDPSVIRDIEEAASGLGC